MATDRLQLCGSSPNEPKRIPRVNTAAELSFSSGILEPAWVPTQSTSKASASAECSVSDTASSDEDEWGFLVNKKRYSDKQNKTSSAQQSIIFKNWQYDDPAATAGVILGEQRHIQTDAESLSLSDFDFEFGIKSTVFGQSSETAIEAPQPRESSKTVATVSPLRKSCSPSEISDISLIPSDSLWPLPLSGPLKSLPFFQYKSMFPRQVIWTPQTSDTESSASALTLLGPKAELNSSRALLKAHFSERQRGSDSVESLDDGLSTLLPESLIGHPPSQTLAEASMTQSANRITYPDLMIFLISNKLLNLESESVEKVYKWIRKTSSLRNLENLDGSAGTTVEAMLEQLLILAVNNGDQHTLKKVLRLGQNFIDLNTIKVPQRLRSSMSLLEVACRMQNPGMIKILLRSGADVNLFFGDYTCLDRALGFDKPFEKRSTPQDMNVIWPLLKAGARMDSEDSESGFGDIIKNCQEELITALLAHGANPNGTGISYRTPLMIVVGSKAPIEVTIRICNLLIQAGADIRAEANRYEEEGPSTVLQFVRRPQPRELLEFLIKSGAPMTEKELFYAVEDGNIPALKFLLDSGAHVTAKILGESASQGSDIFQLILDHTDAKVKESGRRQALYVAIQHGDMKLVSFLSRDVPEIDDELEDNELEDEELVYNAFEKAIVECAVRGDIAMFRFLLSDKSPCRTTTNYKLGLALCYSIREENSELTEFLLAAGAEIDCQIFSPPMTPLLEAIRSRLPDLSARLLQAGATTDWVGYDRDGHRISVLPLAVAWGHLPLIQSLIAAGVDVSAQGPGGEACPLIQAVQSDDFELVKVLINAGANPNSPKSRKKGNGVLEAAVKVGPEMVKYLLANGADPCESCLIAAVQQDLLILRLLWDAKLRRYGRCPQGFGTRALQYAIAGCHRTSINFLVRRNVDTNFIVRDPLPDKWTEGFEILHQGRESAFRTALRLHPNDRPVIQKMLRYGADPNSFATEYQDCTPLLTAIEKKSLSAVQVLIEDGAEVNPENPRKCRRTPLQAAVEAGSMRIIKALIDHGANVNASPCGHGGVTAIQLAGIKGCIGIASFLVEHGAEINAPAAKKYGRTAIEGAAEHGRIDMIQFLVEAGALLMGSGEAQYLRAREFALEGGHRAAWKLLGYCHARQLERQFSDL